MGRAIVIFVDYTPTSRGGGYFTATGDLTHLGYAVGDRLALDLADLVLYCPNPCAICDKAVHSVDYICHVCRLAAFLT